MKRERRAAREDAMNRPFTGRALTAAVIVSAALIAVGASADKGSGDVAVDFKISGDAEVGERLFLQSCAPCHGANGSGQGQVRLPDVDMPDLRDRLTMKSHSDWQIYTIIADGGDATGRCEKMLPAGHRFDADALQDLAAYVKTLPARAYVERSRKD
jgi:mono/diheme cytochrome c family protein